MDPLILASQSPRRRELLSLYGVPFVVEPSRADESQISGAGRERVMRLAQIKCAEVAQRHVERDRAAERSGGKAPGGQRPVQPERRQRLHHRGGGDLQVLQRGVQPEECGDGQIQQ